MFGCYCLFCLLHLFVWVGVLGLLFCLFSCLFGFYCLLLLGFWFDCVDYVVWCCFCLFGLMLCLFRWVGVFAFVVGFGCGGCVVLVFWFDLLRWLFWFCLLCWFDGCLFFVVWIGCGLIDFRYFDYLVVGFGFVWGLGFVLDGVWFDIGDLAIGGFVWVVCWCFGVVGLVFDNCGFDRWSGLCFGCWFCSWWLFLYWWECLFWVGIFDFWCFLLC